MIIKAMLELIKYLADKGNLLCIGYAVTGQYKKRGAAATRYGQYKKRGRCRSENW